MDLIHEALKKAQAEGKLAAPSEAPIRREAKDKDPAGVRQDTGIHQVRLQRVIITRQMTEDVQRIVENIHTAVLKSTAKIVGFTSALPGEGASTIALASATIMADKAPSPASQSNSHHGGILLIDAQLRKPAVHTFYEDPHPTGLIDVLKGDAALTQVVREVTNTNLCVIPFGANHDGQWISDYGEKFRNLLLEARLHFEFIFIDLPSLINYSEGVSLSMLCDGVIMIVQAGQTTIEEIGEAKTRLSEAGINIIGSILNRRGNFIPKSLNKLL
ncbi:MAG: hypothetical protein DWQ05_04715 [Calditrichaeota bacterium]|nr:MAG: hypothetical protein DWQ05_04715 [Calditrichota bacterium]